MAMQAPAPTAAAPPPWHLRAKRAMEAEADVDEGSMGRKAKDDRRAEPAAKPKASTVSPPAAIVTSTPANLQSPELLLAALKTRLGAIKWDEAPRHAPGQLVLRLTVDAAGKVVAVDVVSGDAALGAFLKAKLTGMTSGAKASGKVGTMSVALRVN
jgi:hypothetical protein